MDNLKKVKGIYSGLAVCLIVIGAALIVWPAVAAAAFVRICGVVLVIFGIVKLFGYFSKDMLQLAFQFDFSMGIISCLIGVGMIVWAERFAEILTIVVGLFMLADALLRVQTSIDARRIGLEKWWIILVFALVTAAIGAVLFLKPYHGTKAIVRLLGANLIIDGVLNLYVVQSTVTIIRRKDR